MKSGEASKIQFAVLKKLYGSNFFWNPLPSNPEVSSCTSHSKPCAL